MLLSISTTHSPATDLGYLLHKHPEKLQTTKLSFGQAHIFYPEATSEKTTVCLLLDIDPIEMIRSGNRRKGQEFALGQYVNDRPYVASSFMSSAISKTFSSALNGKCTDRPELVTTKIPIQAKISMLPSRGGGEAILRKFFEPLGYEVTITRHLLDLKFEDWGHSRYFTVELRIEATLQEFLTHLYVLIPALDRDKHYFVGTQEIEKLINKADPWIQNHPEKEHIIGRYLLNLKSLTNEALRRLTDEDEDSVREQNNPPEEAQVVTLHRQRLEAVHQN